MKTLLELYEEFDKITGFYFTTYSHKSIFGFNVLALEIILQEKPGYREEKSIAENLEFLYGKRSRKIVDEIFALEKSTLK